VRQVHQAALEDDPEAAPLRVRRVLDPGAAHCSDCPIYATEYDSYEEMVAMVGIPGDGGTECLGNCRCYLEFETYAGEWGRLSGGATVFVKPLIDLGGKSHANLPCH
jgi:hypothetical protein